MERLQKVIASAGYCSRRDAERLILDEKVSVNGKTVKELGVKVSPNDIVTVSGKTLVKPAREYILLYKPRGVITSVKDDKGRKTVIDLIKTQNRLYPVGRLDYDTSGLLILTNDGELTNILIHPKHKVEKVYTARIDEVVIPTKVKKLLSGVFLDGKKMKADKIRIRSIDKRKKRTIIEITIHEGKNHQVKNMFSALGYKVTSLKREKFAFLDLKGLSAGKYRHLSIKEVKKLYNLKNM